jgi:hypothetical protein
MTSPGGISSPQRPEESASGLSVDSTSKYHANETPQQQKAGLTPKAHYRETEVQPKVLKIVEYIKYDFAKATSESMRQDVADEWADTGLSC